MRRCHATVPASTYKRFATRCLKEAQRGQTPPMCVFHGTMLASKKKVEVWTSCSSKKSPSRS